jgi:hypothetical protein
VLRQRALRAEPWRPPISALTSTIDIFERIMPAFTTTTKLWFIGLQLWK